MAQNPSMPQAGDVSAALDETTGTLRENARQLAEQAASKANDTLEAGRDYAERAYEVGRQKVEEAAFYTELGFEEVVFLVRRHPVTALGIAVGIGFLLGSVTSRR